MAGKKSPYKKSRQYTRKDYMALIMPKKRKSTIASKNNTRKVQTGSGLLKKNLPFLSLLAAKKGKSNQKNALIDTMTRPQLNAYKQTLKNVLKRKYQIPDKVVKSMKRDRKYIYKLLHPKTPESEQRNIMKQKGGFAPLLLPLVTSILPSLMEPVVGGIASAFRKR